MFLGLSDFSCSPRFEPVFLANAELFLLGNCRRVQSFICSQFLLLSYFSMFKLSYQQWQDVCTVVTTGSLQKFRSGKTYGKNLFIKSNVLLSILQICRLYYRCDCSWSWKKRQTNNILRRCSTFVVRMPIKFSFVVRNPNSYGTQ